MKTEEIINLDYRKEESKEIIQKVLRKIKPLSKYSDEKVPLEAIEKVVKIITEKYEIEPQWMGMFYKKDVRLIYSIGIKTSISGEWLGTIYGISVYEVFAKLAIKMYAEVKSGKIAERKPTKEEIEREAIAKKVEKKLED